MIFSVNNEVDHIKMSTKHKMSARIDSGRVEVKSKVRDQSLNQDKVQAFTCATQSIDSNRIYQLDCGHTVQLIYTIRELTCTV